MNLDYHFFDAYNSETVERSVQDKGGVYLLWVMLKDGKWHCFYVGQAKKLKERLLSHLSDAEDNNCLREQIAKYVCGFEFALVPSQRDREGAEAFLVDYFKPECNEKTPGGTPIEVNVPI